MVQQALGMIIENVFKDGQKKILIKTQTLHTENSANLSTNINDTNLNTTFQKTENNKNSEELSWLKKRFENIGLVTLEQKLDTFQLFHENNAIHKNDNNMNSKSRTSI